MKRSLKSRAWKWNPTSVFQAHCLFGLGGKNTKTSPAAIGSWQSYLHLKLVSKKWCNSSRWNLNSCEVHLHLLFIHLWGFLMLPNKHQKNGSHWIFSVPIFSPCKAAQKGTSSTTGPRAMLITTASDFIKENSWKDRWYFQRSGMDVMSSTN